MLLPNTPKDAARRSGCVLLVVTPQCVVAFASADARRWLKSFFSRPSRGGLLPRKVCSWLKAKPRKAALIVRRQHRLLVVRRYRPQPEDSVALLLEVRLLKGRSSHRTYGLLTCRENDVLAWVAAGKSNKEISQILNLSVGTVGKHLERIFLKLGVENRTAAASFMQAPAN